MVENNPMKNILRKIYTDILQLLNLLSEGANFILSFCLMKEQNLRLWNIV